MLPHGFTTAVLVQPSIRFAAGRGYTIANGQFRFGCGGGPHLMDFQDPAAQCQELGNESIPSSAGPPGGEGETADPSD